MSFFGGVIKASFAPREAIIKSQRSIDATTLDVQGSVRETTGVLRVFFAGARIGGFFLSVARGETAFTRTGEDLTTEGEGGISASRAERRILSA